MTDDRRTAPFRKNVKLEQLLTELNEILEPAEEWLAARYRMPQYPVLLVVGLPRSGTTLLTQWLAQSGLFAYPSNFLSRFYKAPAIGARIQKMLVDPEFNFNDEFHDISGESSFNSSLGKTRGVLAPNEFWYFWRRFLPRSELGFLGPNELNEVKGQELAAELGAIEAVFDKPLALKALILQLNLLYLDQLLDRVLFLNIRRHPLYNIQSLLEAREKYFGSREAWYSIKPKEYSELMELSPIAQVAGQVFFTNRALDGNLREVAEERKMTFDYEEFCKCPDSIYGQMCERLAQQGFALPKEYVGPSSFESANQLRVSHFDQASIVEAYRVFSGEVLQF